MDPTLATAAPDRLSLIFPDDGLATWITHIAFEARAPGPSYCFLAIPQGRDNLPAVRCTLAMQVQLARLVRRNVKKTDLYMFASIPPEDPDVGTQTYLAVLTTYRARGAYAVAAANDDFREPQRSTEDIATYYHRLLAARLALKELDREPTFVALVDAFRAGADNTIHGTWIEDIDTDNITQPELQALIYDKGTFREEAKRKSSRHNGPSALAADDSASIHTLIADGVAKALAALLPDARRTTGRNSPSHPSADRTPLKCWYCDKPGHRRRDCKQRLRDIRAGKQPVPTPVDPARSAPAGFPAFGCVALAHLNQPDDHRILADASTSSSLPSPRLVAPPSDVDSGHFVWDWISCSFVDPVVHPSILDLHHDLDHNVTYASLVKPAPSSSDCTPLTPIAVSHHLVTPTSDPTSASPPSSPSRVVKRRRKRASPTTFSTTPSPTTHRNRPRGRDSPYPRPSNLFFTDDSDTDNGDWPEFTLPDPYARTSGDAHRCRSPSPLPPQRHRPSWRDRQAAKARLRGSRDPTPVCPNLVIGNMRRRGPVRSDFTTSPSTTDYRSDTCDVPSAADDFCASLHENIKISSDCLASNFNSQLPNYVNYAKKPRVISSKSDFGIPAATLRGGVRKRSPDRRGLLRVAVQHMIHCPSSVKSESLATFRDLLAARHKKPRGSRSPSTPPIPKPEPLIDTGLPPTTDIPTNLYDDISLADAKDSDNQHHIDDFSLSSSSPSPSHPPDITDLIYCPFHRRLVKPGVYLRNPWARPKAADPEPDSILVGPTGSHLEPIDTHHISSSIEIPDDAADFKFSAPLYSLASCSTSVRTTVRTPFSDRRAPELQTTPLTLKFCQSSHPYLISRPAEAAVKAAPFSPSADPPSALVDDATVLYSVSTPHSPPDLAAAAAAPSPSQAMDLSQGWVMDSGASRHYCCFKDELHNMDHTTSGWVSGLDVEIRGSGACHIGLTACDGTLHTMVLHDVLFVPDLITRSKDHFHRLFSVTAACSKGWSVHFGGCHGDILTHTDTNTSFPLTKLKGLYWVPATRPPIASISSSIAALASTSISKDLLHHRLGHLHDDGISKLATMGLSGIPPVMSTTTISFCSHCHTCKSHVADINRMSTRQSDPSTPFTTVSVDIWGPIAVSAIGGYSWVLGTACHTTSYVMASLMRTKDESSRCFETFLTKIRSFGHTVLNVRVDNDSVLISRSFQDICLNWKINIERTAPYAHFQLARIERQWRTLREMAACMLSYSGLPVQYWGYAFLAAVHIRNRIWSQGSRTIPYLAVTGHNPDLSNLRIFGCPAFVHIDQNLRKKFDKTAWQGIMVGYCSDSPAYLIYNTRTRHVLRSRSVTFDEEWLTRRDCLPTNLATSCQPISGEKLSCDNNNGNTLTRQHSTLANEDLPMPGENQPLVSGEGTYFPPQTRSTTRRLANAENAQNTHNAAKAAIDNIFNIATPSRRQAAVLQLLGDAEEDREGLLQRLVRNSGQSSATHDDPIALVASSDEPSSFKRATSGENSDQWSKAIASEYESHIMNKTWSLVEYPQDTKVIGSMWRFKVKRDADGNIIKYKARLCARGDQQTNGIDYNETFAPTVRYTTLRVLLALACYHDLEVEQFDVVSAFLNADVQETIYMHQPEGYQQFDSKGRKLVCKLNRALYGIKQAPRAWNVCVSDWLENYGFTQSRVDPGIYTNIVNGHLYVLAIYVDDCLLIGRGGSFVIDFKKDFSTEFKIEDLGPVSWLLGCSIERNRKLRTLCIRQRQYIVDILEMFNMSDCISVGTPMTTKPPQVDNPNDPIKDDASRPYAQLVGKLLYLANCTRPDIAAATSHLSRFMSKPTHSHWVQAKRVLRYSNGSKDLCLTYSGGISYDPIVDGSLSSAKDQE